MNTDEVHQFFGSVIKASKAIGVTRTAFYSWISRGYIPFKQQKQIEVITNGKLIALKKDSRRKDNDEDDAVNKPPIYLPMFRYYDKKYGMCEVESLIFRKNKPPKIIYIAKKTKRERITAFKTDNLMQASDMVDSTYKTLYEGDICLLKDKKKFTFNHICMTNYIKKTGKFTIIGNIFE